MPLLALFDDLRILFCTNGPAGALTFHALMTHQVVDPHNLLCATYDPRVNRELLRELSLASVPVLYDSMDSPVAVEQIAEFRPDIVLAMHYPKRVPTEVLRISRVGGMNLHPSLLPRYRGCFSVQWAIINGERETGVTYHLMTNRFDAGSIVLQRPTPILDSDTGYSLFHRLMQLGVDLLAPALIEAVEHPERAQEQTGTPSYFRKELPNKGVIDPEWPASKIERFIRAMTFPPKPPARVRVGAKLVEVRSLMEFERLHAEDGA